MYKGRLLVLFNVFFIAKGFEDIAFADESTFAHNYVRALHLVSPLVWDEGLASMAEQYCKVLSHKGTFMEKSKNAQSGYVGENIFKGFDRLKFLKTMADAVYFWYYEINGYPFDSDNPDDEKHGHFTQVVWNSTTRVGCGRVTKEEYGGLMTYIVCNYTPKGNIYGLFKVNVLPLANNEPVLSADQLHSLTGCVDIHKDCEKWVGVCRQEIFKNAMLKYCKKTCMIC
ncbi:uncharacterized protein LOC100213672 isoform X2 [Hydra vulgaris]|uniref:Uncharacterized protein LOC100213672 isoform X2 n=1 Tax=Hydra vulgaris TaxID=6087 RepID=A0ABM4BEW7_HYDVU